MPGPRPPCTCTGPALCPACQVWERPYWRQGRAPVHPVCYPAAVRQTCAAHPLWQRDCRDCTAAARAYRQYRKGLLVGAGRH